MKTKLYFLLSLLLFILGGCHTRSDDFISKYCPGSCTVIKGKLTTDDRSRPLPGVTLEVYWQTRDMLGLTSNTRRKAVTTTDADGNFELRFLMRDDELPGEYTANPGDFRVKANTDKAAYLYCLGNNLLLEYYRLKRDTTITVNYNLPQRAILQLQPVNLEAMQNSDRLYTSFVFDAGEINEENNCLSGIIWSKSNNQTEVDIAANQQVIVRTTKVKAGIETVTEDIITAKPGQTVAQQVTF